MKVNVMKNTYTSLANAPMGAKCLICGIDDNLSVKGRLEELGFCSGAFVDKLQTGVCGSPIAFRVCGAVIAIRSDDADRITVKI